MPQPPRTRGRSAASMVLALAGVAMLGAAFAAAQSDTSHLPDGVRIGTLDVGGLSTDVARAAVRRYALQVISHEIVIRTAAGEAVRVSPRTLEAQPQVDAAIHDAQQTDGVGHRLLSAVGLAGGTRVPLRFTMSPTAVEALVTRVERGSGNRPQAATVVVTPTALRVVAGRRGTGIDEADLIAQLTELPPVITLDSRDRPPPVSVAEARAARDRARALLAAPPTITHGGVTLTPRAAVLRAALRFVPHAPELEVRLDPAALAAAVRARFAAVETRVRDASFVPQGDRLRIVRDRPGTRIDLDALAAAMVQHVGGTVELPVRVVAPAHTAAQLRSLRITSKVSSFTTPYVCCEPRVTNIKRAVQLLNGTVVQPNATLSLNEVLGQRTLDRGFVSAPQIAGGKFEEAVGGGVSQVATTLYNAAFFAGLEIVTHTPHEFYIGRYPPGREATLSWGGPELVVRNDWPAALYVAASATDTSVTVQMYSRPLGRRVETSTGAVTDRVQPTEKVTVDSTLPPGARVVDQPAGGAGFTISYTRKVFQNDSLVRDERYTWTYHPENALVRVGPGGTTTTPGGATAPGGTTAPTGTQTPNTSTPATTAPQGTQAPGH